MLWVCSCVWVRGAQESLPSGRDAGDRTHSFRSSLRLLPGRGTGWPSTRERPTLACPEDALLRPGLALAPPRPWSCLSGSRTEPHRSTCRRRRDREPTRPSREGLTRRGNGLRSAARAPGAGSRSYGGCANRNPRPFPDHVSGCAGRNPRPFGSRDGQ